MAKQQRSKGEKALSLGETDKFYEVTAPRLGNEALLKHAEEMLAEAMHQLDMGSNDLRAPISEAKRYLEAARRQISESLETIPNLSDLAWKNGKLMNMKDVQIHGLSHTLHYGDGVFEGIRFYRTESGPAIFRLEDHIDRLIYSSNVLQIDIPWDKKELASAIAETVRENLKGSAASHFPRGEGYIRPIIVRGPEKQGLQPDGAKTNYFVFVWDMGDYIRSEMLDISLSNFARIHPKTTVADAKICGNYVNSILSALELKLTGAHEALLLDCEGRIAEGPGENLFIVKRGELHTPQLGNILAGITRASIIQIARESGLEVVERELDIDDLLNADEAFFTGTAAEVKPIRSINGQVIGDGRVGELTSALRTKYSDVVHGRSEAHRDWLTIV